MTIEQRAKNPHERAEIPKRFTDALSEEQETMWDVLVQLSKSQTNTIDEVMGSIWSNDMLPQAFRDRAMLLIIGADVRRNEIIEDLEPKTFCNWVEDAWQHQFRTGVQLIDTSDYQRWYGNFLADGLIDEASYGIFTRQLAVEPIMPGSSGSVYRRVIAECEVF